MLNNKEFRASSAVSLTGAGRDSVAACGCPDISNKGIVVVHSAPCSQLKLGPRAKRPPCHTKREFPKYFSCQNDPGQGSALASVKVIGDRVPRNPLS